MAKRIHQPGCPALLAWDIPGACRCLPDDEPTVPVPDNTAASTTPATTIGTALGHAISELRACSCPECASEVAILRNTADALDALREAVKGCGASHLTWLGNCRWGDLCYKCAGKRDAAIARLLGSEIEGDGNG